MIKNLPANAGDTGERLQSLGQEDSLEKGMATGFSILTCKIPQRPGKSQRGLEGCKILVGPGKLQSMGSQRVRHN